MCSFAAAVVPTRPPQKDTLGFAVSKRGQTFALSHKNVESETWMDCRDLVEEKLQAQKFTVRPRASTTRPTPVAHYEL